MKIHENYENLISTPTGREISVSSLEGLGDEYHLISVIYIETPGSRDRNYLTFNITSAKKN